MLKKIFLLYSSQLYRAAFPLLLVPLIIGLLGTEQYGIVSFFTMLITLIGLLDAGISGTFIKLIAINKNQLENFTKVISLFLKVLCGFSVIACIVAFIFNFFSLYIVNDWLKTSLSIGETVYCIKITGVILALLYIRSYLQSFINGMERQDLIAVWGMCYTTCFYGGGFAVLAFYSNTLSTLFLTWLALSILDVIVTILCVFYIIRHQRKQLKRIHENESDLPIESDISFKNVIKFSLQLSGLSMIWVIASQVDKIALSTFTSLTKYTQYQIGSQLSAVVLTLVIPLSQILLPRLSALIKERKEQQYIKLFSYASLAYIVILAPLVPYMFIFGADLVSLWLKNNELGFIVNQYAKWLVSATFFAGIMNFVFILLYSTGKLKYHFYAYAGYSVITIPLTILIAKFWGPESTSIFYLVHTLLFLVLWGCYCLYSEMISYLFSLVSLSFIVLLISTITFKMIEYFTIFHHYKYIYIFAPPFINLAIMLVVMFSARHIIISAIDKIRLKNW